MIVTLTNGAATYHTDAARVSACAWALPAAGQIGQATVYIPRTSAAWSRTYIDVVGGLSRLRIADSDLGVWDGVVVGSQDEPDGGITLQCQELTWTLGGDRLPDVTFSGLTAGALAAAAYRRALGGRSSVAVLPGAFADAPPVLPSYSFGGKTLLSCLKDLSQQSGQEWQISDRRLSWGPLVGRHYDVYLTDGGDVVVTQGVNLDASTLLKAVTAGEYTAEAAENANRPGARHIELSGGGAAGLVALKQAADAALAQGRVPAVNVGLSLRRHRLGSAVTTESVPTISGANLLPRWLPTPYTATVVSGTLPVMPHGAQVREGDTLTLCLPGAAAGGMVGRFRVLTRAYTAAAPDLIPLTVQYQQPVLAETLAAYAVRPVQAVVAPLPQDVLGILAASTRLLQAV